MIIFKGIDGTISEENGEGELVQTRTAKLFDWLNDNYEDLDGLNTALEANEFSPINEWAEDHENPGWFSFTRMEDNDGLADENGKYEVYYVARVAVAETKPLTFPIPWVAVNMKTGGTDKVVERKLKRWAKSHGYEVTENEPGVFLIEDK